MTAELQSAIASIASQEMYCQETKRPGEDSWQCALGTLLVKCEAVPLSTLLYWNNQVAQQTLLHIAQIDDLRTVDASIVGALAQIVTSGDSDLENRLAAATVLARLPKASLGALSYEKILQQFRKSHIPLLNEALLPLLTKLAPTEQYRTDLQHDLADLATSESVSARRSVARVLDCLSDDALASSEHIRLLLVLLQDEDIDVRQTANRAAARIVQPLSGHRRLPQQSSCTLEQLWEAVIAQASVEDARIAAAQALNRVEQLLMAAQAQRGVLFAVEKDNVYIDPSVNISGTARLLAKIAAEKSGEVQQHLVSLKDARARCQSLLADANARQAASGALCVSGDLVEAEAWLAAIQPGFQPA